VLVAILGGLKAQQFISDAMNLIGRKMNFNVTIIMDLQDITPGKTHIIREDSIVSCVGTTKFI
jgi:hypothetical protein